MRPYQEIPDKHYKKKRNLIGFVSRGLEEGTIPQPDHLESIYGPSGLKHYYLMHSLTHSREHRKKIISRERRDGKPAQTHPFDASQKPYYRKNDTPKPNYPLKRREGGGVVLHELEEDYAKSLFGALVVNHVIRYLISEQAAHDVSFLTDLNALAMGSLKLEDLDEIDDKHILQMLEEKKRKVRFTKYSVRGQYRMVLDDLRKFERYVGKDKKLDEYMPDSQKKGLIEIVKGLSNDLEKLIKSRELLSPEEIKRAIQHQYDHVRDIITKGDYVEVDPRLILPEESKYLIMLKRTLYRDYIRRITHEVLKGAENNSQKGDLTSDDYLALAIEKLADSTDTVSKLAFQEISHQISIQRKARITTEETIDLIGEIKPLSVNYERLPYAVDYLFRTLKLEVDKQLRHLREEYDSGKGETTWGHNLERFIIIEEKVNELEEKVEEIRPPGRIKKMFNGLNGLSAKVGIF